MADAQYVIDIAAQMSGGPKTNAELAALTANLTGSGKNADFFQEALQRVSADLTASGEAAKAANAALAEGNDRYRELERSANMLAKASERAAKKNGGVVPFDLAKKANEASFALDMHTGHLAQLEATAKQAAGAEDVLRARLENVRTLAGHANKTFAEQNEKLSKVRAGLGAVGGSLGGVGSQLLAPVQGFGQLAESMGAARAVAITLTAVAAAVSVALVAAGAAALTWAVGLADANRSARLATEAAEAMHPSLAALHDTIAQTADATGIGADKLRALAGTLSDAGVAAKDMPAALRAAALAEAALGQGGAAEFTAQIKAGGKAVSVLAAETTSKLGGIVAKQMLSLGAQSERLRRNLAGTFGGLDVEPILGAFANVVSMFDESTDLGRELKATFGALFQPLVEGSANAIDALVGFGLSVAITGVKAYIALKPFGGAIEALGVAAAVAGTAFLLTFAPAIWAGVVALGAAVATAAVAAAPFIAIGLAVAAVYEAFTHWTEITALVSGVFAQVVEIGSNMVAGIVDGITGGAGRIVSAIGGAVTGALDHAKALLGIASPSKVMMQLGGYTTDGMAAGLDDGAADVQRSMADAVSPEAIAQEATASGGLASLASPVDAAPAARASSGGGGASLNLAGASFTFNGVKDAEDAEGRFGALLTRLLEGDALAAGAA